MSGMCCMAGLQQRGRTCPDVQLATLERVEAVNTQRCFERRGFGVHDGVGGSRWCWRPNTYVLPRLPLARGLRRSPNSNLNACSATLSDPAQLLAIEGL